MYRVVYAPRALRQLSEIEDYIAGEASAQTAEKFVSSITAFCDSLMTFPQRGTLREDLGREVRILGYRRRFAIVTKMDGATLVIIGVFYGGQDVEKAFRADDESAN
ncbi:type II toxin-antitoxin system RelE/ParE family toxin [Asticcacaulis sp. EMRT-3]|uniref:type II toxin-antitoxin system RelE/ParE family toxin n=1 Tax=Asticcacaulis sp. EMRT-3 TaxID=3040349 RepID=UPI0024AECA9B|nr:type II toxin-antitoxin system RelE/ParE family toxin [Asticcacaulis sp. EMRT-3]MDI7776428.1 type II toxin-antitoxin system RelE/ParE family toxin [Asticcacaulis sp. EMRT-3]